MSATQIDLYNNMRTICHAIAIPMKRIFSKVIQHRHHRQRTHLATKSNQNYHFQLNQLLALSKCVYLFQTRKFLLL